MSSFAVLLGLVLLTMADQTTSHLSSGGPHIADVNILLPPKMTHPVEYRLQGSDGCFKWSWDHHDILSVLPEYNSTSHCSTSARLRSVAPYSGRKETAVYATDVNTGVVIRCKVFIDKLSRIQIFHNSVKLDLDGLATLRVRAFDNEENVFSSLVGLQFMWQLMPETNVPLHHLVHVPLKDSPLSDCGGLCGDLDVQIKLEDSGVFSDMYVVKGIEIGHEIVSVHLLEPQFKHMADKIVLTVAEAMSLDPPSPVLVLVGAAVHYNLKVIRGNKAQVVSLPSSHHQWSSSNSSVAHVDFMTGLTNALSLGVTNVIVEDTRVTGHIQVSSLNVVLPDSLSLYMTPLSASGDPVQGTKAIPSMTHWYGVSGHQYLIQMKVFSQGPDAQEIYVTENDDLKLSKTQSNYWKFFPVSDDIAVKHSWQNSVGLKATSRGRGKLTASLTYFRALNKTKEVLKVVQEVIICDQVKFSLDKSVASQTILLPWAPAVYQEVELKVTGGCANASTDYKWFSSDMGIVSVSASGVVQAKKPGKATIKVLSIFDSFNYDEVVIEVSVPASMSMLHNLPVETVVGSHLQAAVTMEASNGAYFYRCDAFRSFVKWKAGSGPFIIVNAKGEASDLDMLRSAEFHTSSYGSPCSWADLYASASGRDTLHATLSKEYHNFESSFHGPIVLKASSLIAAYPPLNVRQAGDGNHYGGYFFDLALTESDNPLVKLDKMYLVPGTHLDVMLLGGPEQWKNGVEFVETVEIFNKEHGHIDKRQKHGAGDGNKLCFKFVSSGSCPRGETCNFQHDMDAREQSLRGVCFDFMNKGKCERGTDCKFKHSLQDEGEGYSHKRRGTGNATRSTECWFCLSSSKIESHLFISLGEHYYCALAKGPLVEDHVLLIPIGHSPNTLSLSSECEIELEKFQDSLKKFYKKQEKEVVFFEWASKRSSHANLQVVPIPSVKAVSVQNIFHLAADRLGFKFTTTKFSNSSDGRKSLRTQFDSNFSFFYAELPDGTVLSHVIEESEKFLAQFGREVMAGLLNKADRADWRNCTDSKEEETKMVEKFKSGFEEFDPNN